ncbi:MAG: tetraacyldisaccharide 4'-kinase [Rhodomicrobiaceae bacterium]
MRLEPPGWWYGVLASDRLKAALLEPAGFLYGAAVKARFARTTPYRSALPVICIGNFTVGGAGKTPLALAVAGLLREMGHAPAFLTRGYGGRLAGPHRVDAARDEAADVGDEALLLARAASTVVARRRPDGAKAIEVLGADVVIMDDGFQNPSLAKDFALIAVDARAGLGNGRVFPAGPLRAPLEFQTARASAVVMIGSDTDQAGSIGSATLPVFAARLEPSGDTAWLREQPILAFSGIGRPAKFFETLKQNGATIAGERPFPDHHAFTAAEAEALLGQAGNSGALLVTTEKDWIRIPADGRALGRLKEAARPLPVTLVFSGDGEAQLRAQLQALLPKTSR